MHVDKSNSFMALLSERLFAKPPRVLHPEELTLAIAAEHRKEQQDESAERPRIDVRA